MPFLLPNQQRQNTEGTTSGTTAGKNKKKRRNWSGCLENGC